MSMTLNELTCKSAAEVRLARGAKAVAWIETGADAYIELDAETLEHAAALAANWVRPELGARSASSRRVLASGKTRCMAIFGSEAVDVMEALEHA